MKQEIKKIGVCNVCPSDTDNLPNKIKALYITKSGHMEYRYLDSGGIHNVWAYQGDIIVCNNISKVFKTGTTAEFSGICEAVYVLKEENEMMGDKS